MSCLICAETLNGSSRKITKCEFCDFEACLTCCKTFILGEPVAKCMNAECNKEWSRRFLINSFGQTFVNKAYKQHREQLLYDKERALLPATQSVVERIQLCEDMRREIKEIDAERKRLSLRKDELIQTIHRVEDSRDAVERVIYTKACPSSDCRGYLNTQWKCTLCNVWSCPDCHEIKGETRDAEHVCNPDSVATAKLLAADTKPCPNCHTGIHKIDGCDQMWCTICQTAFSWRTGRRETVIHNPHYYEYLRSQSATGEIPRNDCVRDLNHNTYGRIRQLSTQGIIYYLVNKDIDIIGSIIQRTIHITHAELGARYREVDPVTANQYLRISFMRGKITEEKFKVLLQRNEKSNQKRQEIREILQLVVTASTDTIRRLESNLTEGVRLSQIIPECIASIAALSKYANEQFAEISKTYKCPVISLDDTLRFEIKN